MRGLKYDYHSFKSAKFIVAPFAGAWIEIGIRYQSANLQRVAPFAGAWIEITSPYNQSNLPIVAPFAGAWIEILPESS